MVRVRGPGQWALIDRLFCSIPSMIPIHLYCFFILGTLAMAMNVGESGENLSRPVWVAALVGNVISMCGINEYE